MCRRDEYILSKVCQALYYVPQKKSEFLSVEKDNMQCFYNFNIFVTMPNFAEVQTLRLAKTVSRLSLSLTQSSLLVELLASLEMNHPYL